VSEMPELFIVRAGVKSTGFTAGSVSIDIGGTFSREDVEDVLSMLDLVRRVVERQGRALPVDGRPKSD
jgi:hypothetical protein